MPDNEFHRYDGDLVSAREWEDSPDFARRAQLALGPEPIPDARHLLPPVPLPPAPPSIPPGPYPVTEFIVDLVGAFPLAADAVRSTLTPERRASLGYATLWAQQQVRRDRWQRLEDIHNEGRFTALAASRELPNLLAEDPEVARELAAFILRAGELVAPLGLVAIPREDPIDATRRAHSLNDLRLRFSHSVEMRLIPRGRPFPARALWRAAYSLGLTWGHLDLFHWHNPDDRRPLFTVSGVGQPGYFLPERAAEGEGVTGIALSFELPYNPAPLATYDRMGVALSYFRQHLGGWTATSSGAELDADRLWEDRDTLANNIEEMTIANFPPGSPQVARLF